MVHQGDSNSTWANSQEAKEEIEFEHEDAQNNESGGDRQDSLTTNRFIKHMTQIKINNGQTYPTIESLLETETEDDNDESSTATERTTKSSNTHTVTGSSNQTADRPAKETSSNDDKPENKKEITTKIAEIESRLGLFVDPPEENPRCHEVLDRLITLNDLFCVEHKERLNQLITKYIIQH